MTQLDSKQRLAKKEHICNFCGGVIQKRELYDWQKLIYDEHLYVWKSHISCSDIMLKLNMQDECDEGVTEEDFHEFIKEEYRYIMQENHREEYESASFIYPSFFEQLEFVKKNRV